MSGVEATALRYTGDDPDGYALAVNLSRRSMTKGQRAMVAAQACSVSEQALRQVAAATGISKSRIGAPRHDPAFSYPAPA